MPAHLLAQLYALFERLDEVSYHEEDTEWGLLIFSDGMGRVMEFDYSNPGHDTVRKCLLDWDCTEEGVEILRTELNREAHLHTTSFHILPTAE